MHLYYQVFQHLGLYRSIVNQFSQILLYEMIIICSYLIISISKMSIKQIIFLNNIYSPLSYHIIETLRNDHEKLEDYDIFIGTS